MSSVFFLFQQQQSKQKKENYFEDNKYGSHSNEKRG